MCPETTKPNGLRLWVDAAFLYWITAVIVALGVFLGHSHLAESRHHDSFHTSHKSDLPAKFANWDGQWYVHIARDGYSYDPRNSSSIVFFPAFPWAGRWLAWATGLHYDEALTLAANVFFFLALALFADYIRRRPESSAALSQYTSLALALFPVGFFFRMAYSESLFLFLAILTLFGLARQWPIWAVALFVGLATATRAVGVALIAPLMLAAWRRYSCSKQRRMALTVAAPLCVWGLSAFMLFQYARFGDPLLFVKAQEHWRFRDKSSFRENLLATATLEPFWAAYDGSSQSYWRRHDYSLSPIFSLQFANPIYFAGITLLVFYGAWRRWLTAEEVLFSTGALLIPNVFKGHECSMHGHARYAMVAFPAFIVLGRLLAALPPTYAASVLALSGFLLGTYAALFAGWYLFI